MTGKLQVLLFRGSNERKSVSDKWSRSARAHCVIVLVITMAVPCPRLAVALPESRIQVAGAEFELVTIPPGTFLMGSNSGDGDERPVHKVTIDYSFDIGKTEVTVGQFRAFVEATGYETDAERGAGAWSCPCPDQMGYGRYRNWRNPGFDQTEEHPGVCITLNDAEVFCQWLSQQTGQPFRLPTEAEWEYACRAGTTGDYAGDIKEMAWFDRTSSGRTSPVAAKKPNPWGLYDMHGNVWEWCEDIYHWDYRNAPTDGSANLAGDVLGDATSRRVRRVLRGGAWCRSATSCRSAFRYGEHRAFPECGTGFRIVRCSRPAAGKAQPILSSAERVRKPSARSDSRSPKLTLTVGDVEFDFVRIDPGTFVMGSAFRYVDSYQWTYELPAHEVTIGYSYYLGTTEVTFEQFDFFVADTSYVTDGEKQGWAHSLDDSGWHYEILQDWRFPGLVPTDTEPVTHIGLYDAIAFCQWLSEKTGRDIRLPSEAEWECACRAGTTGDYAGNLDEMAWHQWNSTKRAHPVAQKRPNAWGLYDMHGNVWEWVLDVWHDDCNGAPTDGSAWLESTRPEPPGIVRGGSFANPPWLLRSYIRMKMPLGCMVHYNNGFRLVMSAD